MKEDLKEMRAATGRMHEFLMALEKAGFTEETIVEIINSKGNQLAGEMFNSLPERLRTKWKMSDLKLVFKIEKESIHQNFLKSISNNDDEEIIKGSRTLLSMEISKEDIEDKVFRFINASSVGEINGEEIESQIFHFNYSIDTMGALKEILKKGYRPATDYETLTFCEINKEWAKHFQVCALGVKYKGEYFSIFQYIKERLYFQHYYDENNCPPSMRFLGIKIK